ncbi:T9SS type A sorting domain-containing protein [Reichenbachiella sp. MALMAid0571]|uniref:golvesin C-terminal-like domain-containing protein n=1 Tax=Reichenbachiella sp. MALMAid0571 TaxID=3143939 RepID=UPI0032DFFBDA
MKRKLLLLLTSMCMIAGVYAQPIISNVSGTAQNGQTITINGSGFGNTGPNIVIYDEFEGTNAMENGNIPLTSPAIGSWNGKSNEPKYHSSSHSGDYSFALNRGSTNYSQFQYESSNSFTEVFLSYWVTLPNGIMPSASTPGEWNHTSNWKMSWIYEGNTGYGGDNDVCTPTWISPGSCNISGNDQAALKYASASNSSKTLYLSSGWLTFTNWARFTIHMRADPTNLTGWTSDAYVQTINATGQYEKIMDDARVFDDDYRSETNIQTKQWDHISLPGWIGNWDGNRNYFDGVYDDIYIATGSGAAARVEIGNASSYSACTNLALTTPTSWSDNTIATTVRTGSFDEMDTVYLYVIDKDYNVNPTGYPIVIDGNGGVTTHTITASSGTNGTITPSGSVSVVQGNNQSFTITADSGYEISNVIVDGVSQGVVSSYTFTNVQSTHTISASFSAVPIGNEVIVDNGSTGTSQSGSWSSSSYFPGYYGSSYMYAPNATGHWYEWTTSLTAGTYEVYAWWSAVAGRPADAVYDITHSGGTANVTGDQTTNGGQWNLLGTYTFGNTGVVRLNSNANGSEGACADAVKFVEVPTHTITASAGTGGSISPDGSVQVIQGINQSFTVTADTGYQISDVTVDGVSQGAVSSYTFTDVQANHTISASFAVISSDIIVDNGGTGTSQSGSWSSSTNFPGYYGSSYMYAPNATGHWYEWSASLTAGTYEVYAWWSAVAGRPADAVYHITHSGGTANVTGDQTTNGGQWNLLGTYTFGTTGVVRLNSSANGPEGACADAVKFVEAPTIENLALNKSVAVSGEPEPANPGTSAVDGIVTTRWSASGGYPQWLEVDLGDIYNINATEVVCYQDRAYQFTIEAKTTIGGGYSQIVDRSANTQGGSEASPIRDDFTEVAARYVRINVTGANVYSGTWVSLLEFRVFGVAIPIEGGRVLNNKQLLQQVEAGKESGIEVYPNPSSTTLTITVNSEWEGLSKVEVYNTQGQQVLRELEVSFPHQVDISSYQEGIYLIKITNGTNGIVKRIIKE